MGRMGGNNSGKSILELASEMERSFADGARTWANARQGRGSKIRKLAKWPIKVDAVGVMPEQVSEARERYAKSGVPTDFTPGGRAIITGPGHYERVCRLMGVDRR
jgi:hypothetical protein